MRIRAFECVNVRSIALLSNSLKSILLVYLCSSREINISFLKLDVSREEYFFVRRKSRIHVRCIIILRSNGLTVFYEKLSKDVSLHFFPVPQQGLLFFAPIGMSIKNFIGKNSLKDKTKQEFSCRHLLRIIFYFCVK